MEKRLQDSLDALKNHLENITAEQKAEMKEHFRDKTPKGWISIEEHLPQCAAEDFIGKGYSVYKVRDRDGKEFDSAVCDHDVWYYEAKAIGITHWLND